MANRTGLLCIFNLIGLLISHSTAIAHEGHSSSVQILDTAYYCMGNADHVELWTMKKEQFIESSFSQVRKLTKGKISKLKKKLQALRAVASDPEIKKSSAAKLMKNIKTQQEILKELERCQRGELFAEAPAPETPPTPNPEDESPDSDIVSFNITVTGSQAVPTSPSTATGNCALTLTKSSGDLAVQCTHNVTEVQNAHIHGFIAEPSPSVFTCFLPITNSFNANCALSPAEVTAILNGTGYIVFHTEAYPSGEIRGNIIK
jgi:hypothetical protein